MRIDEIGLDRFSIEGLLGEGADLQVFAATDVESGRQVVVKRPHPAYVERQQHRDIERRMLQVISLRQELGDSLPQLSPVIGYTPVDDHRDFFGDSIDQSYMVVVEERARGLPLVGSIVDGLKRRPIGLPQNLFILHPLVTHAERGAFTILRDILDVAKAFYDAGHLLLDLRPQNVFFDPRDAAITVIDVGNVTVERAATNRHAAVDLHDFYLELFKWYTTPADPPEDAVSYGAPYGMDSVPRFNQDLDGMFQGFSMVTWEPLSASATSIVQKIRQRGYQSIDEFRQEFDAYLGLAEQRYRQLSESANLLEAWKAARDLLGERYWSKFLFDVNTDMACYDTD